MVSSSNPEPIIGKFGANDPGPRNVELDRQNPDILTPPRTDNGSIPNLKFSFGMAHNRLEVGGWAREVTVRDLPAATGLAGVDTRLASGVVREMHWHKEAEWGYVLDGRCRVTVVDAERNVYIDDLKAGDIWLFPSGIPHSIQALEEGCEFLLVFNDGKFSENETLLLTEVMAHMPRDVVAKNFCIPAEHFANLPPKEKYIFPLPVPAPIGEVLAKLPKQRPPMPFTVHGDEFTAHQWDGGKTTIIDVRNFPVTNMAALIIELEPGAMREIHWHPNADEWQYYIEGEARMTVFDATSKARTFNYSAGDVGYVPRTLAHYIENIGTTKVRLLNVFNDPEFKDVALNQWLALTPPDLVRGHLDLDDIAMAALNPNARAVVR
ncbi:cupin domain-containing protein [Bradyrhizobium sp. MOS001]|uniref:oxalate decarboxylase family bicupin n=1 Tax=Bradyrhizobium sp. MOS001 TaxID=2133948 RepID=UPI00107545FC|nr:oxalate decarboxylase family bicupin [Bradyrhizobium sp. MOS001]TFW56714.1 cupin domain-containing protein [Bradyrhizobium sp. MOS001]